MTTFLVRLADGSRLYVNAHLHTEAIEMLHALGVTDYSLQGWTQG